MVEVRDKRLVEGEEKGSARVRHISSGKIGGTIKGQRRLPTPCSAQNRRVARHGQVKDLSLFS